MNPKKLAIRLSLGAAILMLVGKWIAYMLTDSVAILSDAAESVVHIGATGVAAISLWYADQPADRQHPYGHGKISFFSAGMEGAFISVAALTIIYTAIRDIVRGPDPNQLEVGLAITGFLALVNLALGLFLVRTGKRQHSLVLITNGQHVLTDMWTSVGVVLGVTLVWLTGYVYLDPIIAIVLGLHIARTALGLIWRAYHGLMDSAEPGITEAILGALGDSVQAGLLTDFHQLRHRRIEGHVWIEVHLLLDGDMSVHEAHERVNAVEHAVSVALPDYEVHITSHMEPEEHHEIHPEGHAAADPLTESSEFRTQSSEPDGKNHRPEPRNPG